MAGLTFQAETTADLGLPLQRAFAEAQTSGSEFTLLLAPGVYPGLTIALDASRQPEFTLRIVGHGPKPVVLQDSALQASATTLALQNLIIADRVSGPPVLQLAADRLEASHLVIAQNHCGVWPASPQRPAVPLPWGGKYRAQAVVGIRSLHQNVRADVAFDACWFMGNLTWDGGALIEVTLNSASDCGFGQLHFEHCLLAGNAVGCDLDGYYTRDIRFEACLIHESRVYAPWLTLFPRECAVTVRGGLLALDARPPNLQPPAGATGIVLEDVVAFFAASREDATAAPLPELPENLLALARHPQRPAVATLIATMLAQRA